MKYLNLRDNLREVLRDRLAISGCYELIFSRLTSCQHFKKPNEFIRSYIDQEEFHMANSPSYFNHKSLTHSNGNSKF